MKKWEYKVLDLSDIPGGGLFGDKERSDVEQYLNRLGQQGWELVHADFRQLKHRFDFAGVAFRGVAKRQIGA